MDFRGADSSNNNPFAKFWTDWSAQMMNAGGVPNATDAREAMLRQMRQAFFDSWARSCEEFLGSPGFLETMKKSMDASLAFRQQMNEFLTKTLHESQAPSRSDTDAILLALHGLEDRLVGRIDQLSARVSDLEGDEPSDIGHDSGRAPQEPMVKPSRPTARKGGAR